MVIDESLDSYAQALIQGAQGPISCAEAEEQVKRAGDFKLMTERALDVAMSRASESSPNLKLIDALKEAYINRAQATVRYFASVETMMTACAAKFEARPQAPRFRGEW